MKKEFTLENLKNIEFDRANNLIIAHYEEKKPLHTNPYGTEFFRGDTVYHVRKSDLKIIYYTLATDMQDSIKYENYISSEIMTNRECYKWINENWDELNK